MLFKPQLRPLLAMLKNIKLSTNNLKPFFYSEKYSDKNFIEEQKWNTFQELE